MVAEQAPLQLKGSLSDSGIFYVGSAFGNKAADVNRPVFSI
tara:strand:- start:1942 stop:2064 length:123 start_codon:yes stop_codon:yes gene_type:complete